jgi:formyl-CoA transferase
LKTIDRKDLIGDPRYDNRSKRILRVDELDEVIMQWSQKKTKKEAVEELLKNRIPSGPVMDIDELMEDPHLLARRMVVDLVHPNLGSAKAKGPGFPIKFSESPDDYNQPAALLGQNNREILGGLLGLDDTAIQRLKEEKVI